MQDIHNGVVKHAIPVSSTLISRSGQSEAAPGLPEFHTAQHCDQQRSFVLAVAIFAFQSLGRELRDEAGFAEFHSGVTERSYATRLRCGESCRFGYHPGCLLWPSAVGRRTHVAYRLTTGPYSEATCCK